MESVFEIFNEDCLQTMKGIKSHSVDLILTDPPYNLGLFMKSRGANLQRMRSNFFVEAGWDNTDYEQWKKLMEDFFMNASRIMKSGGSMILFMAITKVETIKEIAERYGFYYKTTGIWHKTNPMPRNMNLHFVDSIEGWMYFVYEKHTGTFNNDGRLVHNFLESSVAPKSERRFGTHPTQKPVSILSDFVNYLSNENEIIYDPFMGSGSTGETCMRLNRKFIGSEMNEKYFDIAIRRLIYYT